MRAPTSASFNTFECVPKFRTDILCEFSAIFLSCSKSPLVLSPLHPLRATTQPTECPSHQAPTIPLRSGSVHAKSVAPRENNSQIRRGTDITAVAYSPNSCNVHQRRSVCFQTHFPRARLQGENDVWKRQKTRITYVYLSESLDRVPYVDRQITLFAL